MSTGPEIVWPDVVLKDTTTQVQRHDTEGWTKVLAFGPDPVEANKFGALLLWANRGLDFTVLEHPDPTTGLYYVTIHFREK